MAAASRRLLHAILSVALVLGVVVAAQFVAARHASRAHADPVTGSAGLFTAAQGRLIDTRTAAGGSGPVTANTWYPIQAGGVAGIPSSGVSSVQISVTAITPAASGLVRALADGTSGTNAGIAALLYTGGAGTISAESIVPVSAGGAIDVEATTSIDILITVQGYYSTGNGTAAPGGYVPVSPSRIVDTRNGTGLPQAKLNTNSTTAVSVGGVAGVPSDAAAVFVMLTAVDPNTTTGYFNVYPVGTSRPANVSLSYSAATSTVFGTAVALGTSGQINIWIGPNGSSINFIVDVVGYYTSASSTKGAFTPAGGRIYDTRVSPNTSVPANSSRRIQVGGIKGLPLPGSGISAYALNAQVVHSGSSAGYLALAPGDQRIAAVTSTFFPSGTSTRSDLAIVPTAGDGTVLIVNGSNDPIDVILDIEGWYSSVGAAIPNGQTRTQQYLTLQGDSSSSSWVRYQYRKGTTGAWTDVPVGDVTPSVSAWPVQSSGSPATFAPYTWNAATTLGSVDQLFQVQACYSQTSSGTPTCSMASSVQLAVHSFGDSYATYGVGPGSLSLQTGDYQVSATDVSVATYQGSLSIGRTFTTLAPINTERGGASGILGPGWTPSLPGADVGDATLSINDKTATDGYLIFTDSDGSTSIYEATSSPSTYPVTYAGTDDAAAAGATVTKTAAGTITMTDADGTTTTWNGSAASWVANTITEAGSAATTTFTPDPAGSGRITRILGATAGVTCSGTPDSTPGVGPSP